MTPPSLLSPYAPSVATIRLENRGYFCPYPQIALPLHPVFRNIN